MPTKVVEERWGVLYLPAFNAWAATEPGPNRVARALEWVEACKLFGPPTERHLVIEEPEGDQHCIAGIPGTTPRVLADYRVIPYERLIIVRKFSE